MISGLYQKRRKRPEMNLVPLIDVLVMLIFFSFVTMQFKSAVTMNITLPKFTSAGKNEFKGKVEIAINKDGVISL
jgi:biopolymer transport protein ExbD